MNVPKEIPTTSQMICLLVSHTIELYFVLPLNSGIVFGNQAVSLPKVKAQSTKHKAQSTKYKAQFRSLSASVAARAAALRSRIELRRYASRPFADKNLRHSDRLKVRARRPVDLPRGPLREATACGRR